MVIEGKRFFMWRTLHVQSGLIFGTLEFGIHSKTECFKVWFLNVPFSNVPFSTQKIATSLGCFID